jgi:hypothetical protein
MRRQMLLGSLLIGLLGFATAGVSLNAQAQANVMLSHLVYPAAPYCSSLTFSIQSAVLPSSLS